MKRSIWVVVADGRRARIFRASSPRGKLTELETMAQTETALPGRALWRDRPGRTFDSGGPGRHAKEAETGHREQAKSDFARDIGRQLEAAYHAGKFEKLVLVSEPGFLGHLRRHLNGELQHAVSEEVGKDLTTLPADKIRKQLPDKLAPAIEP